MSIWSNEGRDVSVWRRGEGIIIDKELGTLIILAWFFLTID